MSKAKAAGPGLVDPEAVDAVLGAARVLVDVVASSLTEVGDEVTLPQFRVLVLVGDRGTTTLSDVAEHLQVHASNATRACDRLVANGLLDRQEHEADRRYVSLSLTSAGERVLGAVMAHRRTAIGRLIDRMDATARQALVPTLVALSRAAEDQPGEAAEPLGWKT